MIFIIYCVDAHYIQGNCYYSFHLSDETVQKITDGIVNSFDVMNETCRSNKLLPVKIPNAAVNNFIYDKIIHNGGLQLTQ